MVFVVLSGVVVMHSAVRHEAFNQCYISTGKMIVIFRSLESGKTIMMCMDVCTLSRILECYDIRLNKYKVDRFFSYTRVYFSSSTDDYNFSVSAHIYRVIDNMAERLYSGSSVFRILVKSRGSGQRFALTWRVNWVSDVMYHCSLHVQLSTHAYKLNNVNNHFVTADHATQCMMEI